VGQNSNRLGIAFEKKKIVGHLWIGPEMTKKLFFMFSEPGLDSQFASVTERGVANVMEEAAGCSNQWHGCQEIVRKVGTPPFNYIPRHLCC